MEKKIASVVLAPDLYEVLKQRAEANKRSLSGEINYLIELGLSSSNEELLRLLTLVDQLK